MINERPPWLRLVHERNLHIDADSESQARVPEQLSLPLPEPDIIFILNVSEIRFNQFDYALHQIKPKWIFDIRTAPRLDKIAGSRNSAFRAFDRLNLNYLDVFGILGINDQRAASSNPAFWMPWLTEVLISSHEAHGPYFALLDSEPLIEAFSSQVRDVMPSKIGKEITLTRLMDHLRYHSELSQQQVL